MTELWPTLLRPAWLLLLVPSVWLLWRLWRRQRRSGRWQLLLPRPFHALLLSGGDARGARLPWVALGLAWLLAVLALAGPSWQRLEQASAARGDALVVILDLTPRMLAADRADEILTQRRQRRGVQQQHAPLAQPDGATVRLEAQQAPQVAVTGVGQGIVQCTCLLLRHGASRPPVSPGGRGAGAL